MKTLLAALLLLHFGPRCLHAGPAVKPKVAGVKVSPVAESKALRVHGDSAHGFCIEEHSVKLRIRLDGKPVADYISQHPEVRRPFWMHLRNREGVLLTRNFPPQEGDSPDHADMHPGLWLAFGGINGVDFWRNKGRVEQMERKDITSDGFTVVNRWLDAAGREICRDTTQFHISLQGQGISLRWQTNLGSTEHDLIFDGQEEAGLGIRVATPLSVRDGSGHITSSSGEQDEKQCWGKPAAWWRYGTDTAALRIAPAEGSSRPSWGHVRDYGVLVVNPTGVPDTKKKPAAFVVPKGQPFRLVYDIQFEN